jgi:hypothetical protein
MVNDHYWCSRIGVECSLCGLTMANCECGGLKRMQWLVKFVLYFTPLGITFGCIELTLLVCIHFAK